MKNLLGGLLGSGPSDSSSASQLAGLLVLSGRPVSAALQEGAFVANQKQQQEIARAQFEQQRQMALQAVQQDMERRDKLQQLGDFFKNNPNASPTAGAGMLFESGVVEPQNIAGLAGLFGRGNEESVVKDPVYGNNLVVTKRNGQVVDVRPLGASANQMPYEMNLGGMQGQEMTAQMDNNPSDYGRIQEDIIQPNEINNKGSEAANNFLDYASQKVRPQNLTSEEKKQATKSYYKYIDEVVKPSEKGIEDLENDISKIRKALKYFKTGIGADSRKTLAELEELVGIDKGKNKDGLTKAAAAQLLDKSAEKFATTSAKAIFGTRITNDDLKAAQKMVPNKNMSILAIEELLKDEEKKLKKAKQRNKLVSKYYNKFKDISDFDNVFREYNSQNFTQEPATPSSGIESLSTEQIKALLRG